MFVARRMQRNVVTVSPKTSLREARELMRGHNIHQLPVTAENGTLLGILSHRDIRGATIPANLLHGKNAESVEKALQETPTEKVMTRKVVTATVTDTLEDALVLLHDFRINALPVLDNAGKVVGIISRTDVLRAFISTLGIGEVSSRLEVLVPDRPGELAAVVSIIRTFHVNITSLLTTDSPEEGKRAIFLRVNTLNIIPIRKAIEEAGFRILDPSSFIL